MKLYLLFITLVFSNYSINAQIVDIPDANFKYALVNYQCVDTDGDGSGDSDADTNDDGEIQVSEAQAVLWLKVSNNNIYSLEGIQSFINLENLNCINNQLIELDFSNNTSLVTLSCDKNQLTSLNVTQNSNLEFLTCTINDLTVIDITQNLNLKTLNCFGNNLTNIDVSQNTNLEWLQAFANQLTSIDITNNLNLWWLSLEINQLTSLDVTQNLNLEYLHCNYNLLTSLDVTQNINLRRIICKNNQLTSLNVTQNPLLSRLNFSGNPITSIDLSQNLNLTILECTNTQLTSLNIRNGNNFNLNTFYTFDNPNLYCIQVDDENATVPYCEPWDYYGWCKDDWTVYSEDCILGLEDNTQISFSLYPNPTQEVLYIDTQQDIESVKIYSLQGQLIKESSSSRIDVSYLSLGLYFVQVNVGGNKITKKFIKE